LIDINASDDADFGIITLFSNKRSVCIKIVFFPTLEIHHG